MEPRELLAEWHTTASLHLASIFLLQPLIEKGKLDFIRDTLMTEFDGDYFQLQPCQEIASDEIHWIKSLLMVPERLSAVKALYELALQLRYCQRFPSLYKEFKRVRPNLRNLRSFFFELFIDKTLDEAGIPTEKMKKVGRQVMEGFCTLNGKEFLFECKLPYIPGLEELFLVQRLMKDFHEQGSKKVPLNGYSAALYIERPMTAAHREALGRQITKFYQGLPSGVPAQIDYLDPGPPGRLEAKTFSPEVLAVLGKEDKADVMYYLEPTGEVTPDGVVQMKGKVSGKFNVLVDKLYQKLASILLAEREQHPPEKFPLKIVFLGSESFPEFQFGIFQDESMFDLDRVLALCNTLKLGCIVCFVRKYYQLGEPYVKADVIGPMELAEEAQQLKDLFDGLPV